MKKIIMLLCVFLAGCILSTAIFAQEYETGEEENISIATS